MSKSKVTVTKIKFVPPPDTPTIRLTVDLTVKQAEDIRGLCHFIGGDPDHTTRGVFSEISAMLQKADASVVTSRLVIENGGVHFKY